MTTKPIKQLHGKQLHGLSEKLVQHGEDMDVDGNLQYHEALRLLWAAMVGTAREAGTVLIQDLDTPARELCKLGFAGTEKEAVAYIVEQIKQGQAAYMLSPMPRFCGKLTIALNGTKHTLDIEARESFPPTGAARTGQENP